MNADNVVFFDGVCNFCNRWVNWLILHNRRDNLRFASLQGKAAGKMLDPVLVQSASTVVYLRKGRVLVKSKAVVFIVRDMAWYGYPAIILLLVPAFIRDFLYDGFAQSRYRWFGKQTVCRIPKANELSRFLDE